MKNESSWISSATKCYIYLWSRIDALAVVVENAKVWNSILGLMESSTKSLVIGQYFDARVMGSLRVQPQKAETSTLLMR